MPIPFQWQTAQEDRRHVLTPRSVDDGMPDDNGGNFDPYTGEAVFPVGTLPAVPVRYSPRPVRALCAAVAFYGILATRAVLAVAVFLSLGLVPA